MLCSRSVLLSILGLGGEPLRETFTICTIHSAILQCVTIHHVPKFMSCHNRIMVVTGRAHCSIVYIYIYIYTSVRREYVYIYNFTLKATNM